MRSVVCKELGPPEQLDVVDGPAPEPREGQVRIAVKAAGVNYVDGLIAAGRYQVKLTPPFVPGSEVAGVIDAVGPGVDAQRVGERVFATLGVGGFAEATIARATDAQPIPASLDFPRAASFHQAYCTAWFAFTRRTTVQPGEWALVTGAGGGIGLAAVDVARALGMRVIAVASTDAKRKLAEQAGAEATIDSRADDVKTRAREISEGGVDVVYDAVGGDLSEPCLRALRFDGRFLVIGFTGGIAKVPMNLVLLNNRTVIGVEWGGWVLKRPDENRVLVAEVLDRIAAGDLHPVAPAERPLEDAGAALADLLGRRAAGKIVLVP
jgi:NADPH2:quinone reductase